MIKMIFTNARACSLRIQYSHISIDGHYHVRVPQAAQKSSDVTTRLTTADIMTLCGQLDPVAYRNYHCLFVCRQILL